jgi:hypothetical protein
MSYDSDSVGGKSEGVGGNDRETGTKDGRDTSTGNGRDSSSDSRDSRDTYNPNASPSSDTQVNASLEKSSDFNFDKALGYGSAALSFAAGGPAGILGGLRAVSQTAKMPDTAGGWSVVTKPGYSMFGGNNVSNSNSPFDRDSYRGGSAPQSQYKNESIVFRPTVSSGISSGVSSGVASPMASFGNVEESVKAKDGQGKAVVIAGNSGAAEKPKDSTLTMLASGLTVAAIVYQFWKG